MIKNIEPLISVIVPVYNVENYLSQCVDSLLKQTFANIEIILVDDGSTDKSPNICDMYSLKYDNIKVIHKKNGGLGSARNEGLKNANGIYVGFVDSDDYVSEKMYETLFLMIENYKADCAFCEFTRFWDNDIEINNNSKNEIKLYSDNDILNEYLLNRIGLESYEKEDCSYGASVAVGLFKKSIILSNSISFVSERKIISEDMIFDIEFIPQCKRIVHTNEILYYYRFNPNSLTTNYLPDRFEKNVSLYFEMDSRLETIYCNDIYKERLDRYFLKITRIALIEEMNHVHINGWKNMIRNIDRITCNKKLEIILKTYPLKNLPIKQKLFFYALKHKNYLLILVFLKGYMVLEK